MADEAAQEAGIKRLMIRHRQGGAPSWLDQDDVAGRLASDDPAGSLESLDSLAPRAIPGQLGHHTAMRTTSSWGWRCFSRSARSLRTARQPRMASLMFARVSCFVRPWDTHPGIAGHSATYPRISPRRRTTFYIIEPPLFEKYTAWSQ